jgi:hypothetical protein
MQPIRGAEACRSELNVQQLRSFAENAERRKEETDMSAGRILPVGLLLAVVAAFSLVGASHAPTLAQGATVSPELFGAAIEPEEEETFTITVETGPTPIPKIDVVFAFDRTSSMGDEINVAKDEAISIMDGIRDRVPDSWFGVVSFMDYPGYYSYPGYADQYGDEAYDDVPWENTQDLTANLSAVSSAINGLSLGWGADGPECYTRALYEVMSVEWRALTKKIVIMIGDAPTHDLDFAGHNFGGDPGRDAIAMTSDDLNFETVVSQLRNTELVTVLAVQGYAGGGEYQTYAEHTFKGMSTGYAGAAGTNGQYYLLDDAGEIPDAIEEMMESEVEIIDVLTLDVPEEYADWVTFSPNQHTDVGPDTTVTFDATITVPEGTSEGEHSFLIQVLGDGALLGATSVNIIVPSEVQSDDLGFRANPDGYGFKNDDTSQSWDMFQQFFGADNVLHSNGDRVYVAAQFFNDHYSGIGNGGSCDGFSATSLINWENLGQPNSGIFAMPHYEPLYDAGEQVAMWNAIAYQQGFQLGWELIAQDLSDRSTSDNSPTYYYEKIKQYISNGEPVVLWMRPKDGGGGHSVVPYRFEESGDNGLVYVYDNNDPGDANRKIEFDLAHDEWKYTVLKFWIIPLKTWSGDSSHAGLAVHPLSLRLHKGLATWNIPEDMGGTAALVGVAGNATIEPDAPDAEPILPILEDVPPFELYYVPGADHDAAIQGTGAGAASISVYTRGMLAKVETSVTSSTADRLEPSVDGTAFSYQTGDISKGYSATLDKEFVDTSRVASVRDTTISAGEAATFEMNPGEAFTYTNEGGPKSYDLMLMQLGSGAGAFEGEDISMGANETHIITPTDWDALDTAPIILEIDKGNDGTIDETRTLVPLAAGWNDKCYVGDSTSVQNALTGISDKVLAVYVLRPSQQFDRWFPARPELSTIGNLNPYDQLFVLMSEGGTWERQTSTQTQTTVNLVQGWNSICYTGETKSVGEATSGITEAIGILYSFLDTQAWERYVPNRPDVSTMSTLTQLDSVLLLITQDGGTAWVFDP